jgi:hypothetical protein
MAAGREIVNCLLRPGPPIASKAWTASVIDQTMSLARVSGECELSIEVVLPAERELLDSPAERRLDYLLRRLLDALEGTILRGDGALADGGEVIALKADRRVAATGETAGIRIVLRQLGARN